MSMLRRSGSVGSMGESGMHTKESTVKKIKNCCCTFVIEEDPEAAEEAELDEDDITRSKNSNNSVHDYYELRYT